MWRPWATAQFAALNLALTNTTAIPHTHTYTHTLARAYTNLTALFRDYPGEPVPER